MSRGAASAFLATSTPPYAGNVVKAMASAKQGHGVITKLLEKKVVRGQGSVVSSQLSVVSKLRATVHEVNRLTPTIVEIVVHAPLAAKNFQPGQFYKLQNYEGGKWKVESGKKDNTSHLSPATYHLPAFEPLALTGAWVDKERGLLGTIVLEMGGSSDLCAYLKPGEPVVLMGPTGTPTHIPHNETVVLVGGGLGNAVLFSIGRAMRENGCKVLYFAGYKKAIDRYKLDDIEAAADVVVWACDETLLEPRRPQDLAYHGNIIEAMKWYFEQWSVVGGQLSVKEKHLATDNCLLPTSLIAIGSDRMMAAVAAARYGVLKEELAGIRVAVGSINSPMQCMMKEICAQCLQEHIDPVTGKKTYVYSCFNQDQDLDCVSFPHLNARLSQNTVQEKLTARWIQHVIKKNLDKEAIS